MAQKRTLGLHTPLLLPTPRFNSGGELVDEPQCGKGANRGFCLPPFRKACSGTSHMLVSTRGALAPCAHTTSARPPVDMHAGASARIDCRKPAAVAMAACANASVGPPTGTPAPVHAGSSTRILKYMPCVSCLFKLPTPYLHANLCAPFV